MKHDSIENRCVPSNESQSASAEPQAANRVVIAPGPKLSSSFLAKIESFVNASLQHDFQETIERDRYPSVYVGAFGIAYTLLRLSQQRKEPQLADRARAILENTSDIEIVRRFGPSRAVSIVDGAAGAIFAKALLYLSENNQMSLEKFSAHVRLFEQLGDRYATSDASCEDWLYGKVGYLYGCLKLNSLKNGAVDESLIQKIVNEVLHCGKKNATTFGSQIPLLYFWHEKCYLGAAHGMFGIFYILISAHQFLSDSNFTLLHESMKYLVGKKTTHNNWPAVLDDKSDHLVHFCHGAPGAIYSLIAMYQKTGEEMWKREALLCAETVWKYGVLKKGGSLCHGISGNGYGLLAIYRLTRDAVWLERAAHFASLLMGPEGIGNRCPGHPASLFEGKAGWLCYLSDLAMEPLNSRFPMFEL